jgi:hypothetical protein
MRVNGNGELGFTPATHDNGTDETRYRRLSESSGVRFAMPDAGNREFVEVEDSLRSGEGSRDDHPNKAFEDLHGGGNCGSYGAW